MAGVTGLRHAFNINGLDLQPHLIAGIEFESLFGGFKN
jgi:hypothetical protein